MEGRLGRKVPDTLADGAWDVSVLTHNVSGVWGAMAALCTRKQSCVKAVPGPAIWVTGELWTQQVLLKALEVRSPEPHLPRL